MIDEANRRRARLERYEQLRAARPHLFENPTEANPRILFDREDQDRVADQCAAQYAERGIPAENADIGVVYEDPYVLVVRDAVRFGSGRENSYVRVLGAGDGVGAVVLPVTSDGRLALIRHYRHDDRRWHWEAPRGFGEPGSSGVETARRELAEELRIDGATFKALEGFGDETQIVAAYLSEDASAELAGRGGGTTDDDEGIDGLRLFSGPDLRAAIVAGEMDDQFTLAALAIALAHGAISWETGA